jgi:hypothetical protein
MNGEGREVSVDRRVELLGKLITLPATPLEVWFEEVPRGTPGGIGPTDFTLIAVLRFPREDIERISRAAKPRPDSPPRLLNVVQRPWLPDPVRSAIQPFDERSVTIRGQKFDATPFAKSPLLSGAFVAVEGGEYALLVLGTR